MVSIAQTCPFHNCSHLGKAVVKPSTVLESTGWLHNSAPKFGLSFTGLLYLLMNTNQISTPLKTLIGPTHIEMCVVIYSLFHLDQIFKHRRNKEMIFAVC